MRTLTIPQSSYRNIHSLANQHHDREINFPKGSEFAVVYPSYFGGKGYTTHRTEEAAIRAANKEYYCSIVGDDGAVYDDNGNGQLYLSHNLEDQ